MSVKIVIVGIGYVGLSNALLLAASNEVTLVDTDEEKVKKIINKIPPIGNDKEIDEYLTKKILNLIATTELEQACCDAQWVVVATPTDYDTRTHYFDTSSVESVIQQVNAINTSCTIVIKSTVPVGFTQSIKEKLGVDNIIFSPEFLREGKALYDNLYPSRIIVGDKNEKARDFARLLAKDALKENIDILYTDSTEAEAIKLFSNTYLAMRVAYFNELDSYALTHNLDTKQIIEGVCLDPRIGNYYNNPSFGYGGYCLPKDTKQLKKNFEDVPNNIISAVVDANVTRKSMIVDDILKRNPKVVGIYRLVMKTDSDNFRYSAVQDIMKQLKERQIEVIVYEPMLIDEAVSQLYKVVDFETLKRASDMIVANRLTNELHDVIGKVYTRDIFSSD